MKTMNFSVNNEHDVRLTLSARQVASTREAKGLSIECVRGSIWVTLEDGGFDHVLNPGERLPVSTSRRVVIEALTPSEVVFFKPLPLVAKSTRPQLSPTPYAADCWVCL